VAVFGKIIDCFQANLLTLNLKKTHYMYFKVKMSQTDQSPLKHMNKQINSTHCIDFLGVSLDSTLSWQGHIRGQVNNYPQCSCICVSVGSTVVLHSITMRGLLVIISTQV
jgi:hypothetical protein